MNHPPLIHLLCSTSLGLIFAVGSTMRGAAGTPDYMLLHGQQDSLLLGTVTAVSANTTQVTPHLTLDGRLLQSPLTIYHETPLRYGGKADPELAQGDRAIFSLRQQAKGYRLAWGVFQVSSLNPTTLQVLRGSIRGETPVELQWYVNTCGRDKDFSYAFHPKGAMLTVKKESIGTAIARNENGKWIPLVKAPPANAACTALFAKNQIAKPWFWIPTLLGVTALLYVISRMSKIRKKPGLSPPA